MFSFRNILSSDMIYWVEGYYESDNRWLNLDWFISPKSNIQHPGSILYDVSYRGEWYYIPQKHCMDFEKYIYPE